MAIHELKTWPRPFDAMKRGEKTFEFRKNDRNFQVGDVLMLNEYDPGTEKYTGEGLRRTVTYILFGGIYGLPEGYVVMAVVT